MKRFIAFIIILSASCTLSAKEVCRNSNTGMVLSENLGVYTITGKGGALILGDLKESRNLLASFEKCFLQTHANAIFDVNIGEQKYQVKSDSQGLYIIKMGLGAVKIYQSDVSIFLLYLEAKIAKNKGKEIWDVITK